MRNATISAMALAAALLAGVFAITLAAAAKEGQLAFNNHCRTCHSTDEGDNRLGPNLHEIMGREAGAANGYRYSSAFESADFKWTAEKMDRFIADPESIVRGNNMKPYSGVAEPEVRAAIVEYLSGKADDSAANEY